MNTNRLIEERFTELLLGVKVNGEPYLEAVTRWKRKPPTYPCLMYMYRPHQPVAGAAGGQLNRILGAETGVLEVTYSWAWELYVGLQSGEQVAQEEFMAFDQQLALDLSANPLLGGAVYGMTVGPLGNPSFNFDENRGYLYVPMEFTATAEEGE